MTGGMLAVLLLASMCWGQQVKLPAEVKGEAGAFIKVPAETDGKEVRWYSPDKGLQVFPVELLRDSKTAVVTGAKGRYRLIAWTAKGDVPSDPAICTVIIGDVPPGPGPVPPDPTDPLTKTLQAAFDKESAADKAALKASLTALYRQASEVTNKPEIVTWGQLFTVIKTASGTLGTLGKLPTLQAAVGEELKKVFPTDAAKTMTTDDRVLAAQTFKRLATAMEGVR
jgi:hypothetical protein